MLTLLTFGCPSYYIIVYSSHYWSGEFAIL